MTRNGASGAEPIKPGDKISTHWRSGRPGPIATRGYRSWVDEQIEAAMARGDFDRLPGRGRPLQLDDNPLESGHWLEHHIMKNAGVLPAWVELDREIRAEVAALRRMPRGAAGQAERIAAVNAKIDRFNLLVPALSLQKPRLPADGC